MNADSTAHGSLTDLADAAFERAAAKAVAKARQTNTPVIVWEDDHVQEITPEQIAHRQKQNSAD